MSVNSLKILLKTYRFYIQNFPVLDQVCKANYLLNDH